MPITTLLQHQISFLFIKTKELQDKFFLCNYVVFVIVSGNGRTRVQDMAATEPLMKMVVHCIDRIKSFKLGKEVCCIIFQV